MTVLTDLVDQLARQLTHKQLRLATVESCTGGRIGGVLTDKSGSSDWYEGGWITYSNALKTALGVDPDLIDQYGAVSEEVALAMVSAGRAAAGVDCCISVTGVAGPTGGSAEKPVGTVWIGWALPGDRLRAQCHQFEGDRASVREQSIVAALSGLLQQL
ncbi:CinA family protein [Saccharospirillum salsuginis]|uniref:Damage-inducible protein CinA n=1 Tax=Saccharospirillum salsuginis TaxID=418750 RepID=A0A918KI49_9GAMM|nr:CinA family protein [Saccharospirillum salsuginis]GGX61752.1 damage-inducible protein CinA [Saccharospirillum salsuginis]